MYVFAVIAAAAAVYFAGRAVQHPRPGAMIASVVWGLYAVYEVFINNGVLCGPNCNIRVDLLIIWPLVWFATLFGLQAKERWNRVVKIAAGSIGLMIAATTALFLYMVLVEGPAADRAARAKRCAGQGLDAPDCPPASPSTGTAR